MQAKNLNAILVGLISVFLLCACASANTPPTPTLPAVIFTLRPYHTSTPSPAPTAVQSTTITAPPSPSPTPQIHIVKKGEDLGGIAYRYGLTLAQLMAANPDVNPNTMSVDTELKIPAVGPVVGSTGLPSPTPIALPLSGVWCARSADKGAWCSILVSNPYDSYLENIEVEIRAINPDTGEQITSLAAAALNLLPPGKTIPVVAYFPPTLPVNLQFEAALKIALPAPESDQRYLPVRLDHQTVDPSEDGLSAAVSVDIFSDTGENSSASQIWVLLVAYDAENHVIGYRRVETQGQLSPEAGLTISDMVYSFSGAISRVEAMAEARP